jgi:hypothetical protein
LQFFSRDFDFGKSEENQCPNETMRVVSPVTTDAERIIARGELSLGFARALHANCDYGWLFNQASISLRARSLASP